MSCRSAVSMPAPGRDTGTDRFSRARATATSPGHTRLELRPRANSPPIGGVLHQCLDLRDPLSTWLAAIDLGHAGSWGWPPWGGSRVTVLQKGFPDEFSSRAGCA